MIKQKLVITLLLIGLGMGGTGIVEANAGAVPPIPENTVTQEQRWWRYGMQAALNLPTPTPPTLATKQAYQAGMKAMRTWQVEQPAPIIGWEQWLANLSDQRLAALMAKAPRMPMPKSEQVKTPPPAVASIAQPKVVEKPPSPVSVPVKNQLPPPVRVSEPSEPPTPQPTSVIEHPVIPSVTAVSPTPANNLPRLTTPLTKAQQQFINHLKRPAQQIGRRYDLYPSVLLAQAALESNWGTSDLAARNHNYFGIKGAYRGQGVQLPTLEHYQGHDVTIMDQFKHYPDLTSGLVDYAMVLDDPVYQRVHRRQASTYQQATKALTGVYATDPDYDLKLNQLISSYHFDRFDHQASNQPINNQGPATKVKTTAKQRPAPTPTVKHGTWKWSMLGGIGSAGLWIMAKRFW